MQTNEQLLEATDDVSLIKSLIQYAKESDRNMGGDEEAALLVTEDNSYRIYEVPRLPEEVEQNLERTRGAFANNYLVNPILGVLYVAAYSGISTYNSTIYLPHTPDIPPVVAQALIQCGVQRVVGTTTSSGQYWRVSGISRKLLEEAGIQVDRVQVHLSQFMRSSMC